MAKEAATASYGAEALKEVSDVLPNQFPRIMGPNCMAYLREVVESGLTSDMVRRFEERFARIHAVKHCIATPGCTPALAMLAAAFEFEPGDEIIVSSVTDYGTVQGLLSQGYIPVFADTAPGTIVVSADTIEPCITDRTRAILVVHMTGLICDMDPINALAARHGLTVYEDACQALFGRYKGRLAGTLGRAAAFSFDPEKTMGSDTGGCVLTNDDHIAERCRYVGQARGACVEPGFGRVHTELGYAYRMPQSTAAICLGQLEVAQENVARRDRMIRLLSRLTSDIPGVTPLPIPAYMDVYSAWMFGMSVNPRAFRASPAEIGRQLQAEGIPGVDNVGGGLARYYLMPRALRFVQENARLKRYPFSTPPASHEYRYDETTCPAAFAFLETFIRWATFCQRYTEEHCQIAAEIVRRVADRCRR